MPANVENAAVATGLETVSFHSNSKECNAKKCFNYHTTALILHARKYSKSFKRGFSSVWTKNFQMYNLGFKESEESESESEVAQSCPTLCDPLDCSLSTSSVHGIFQARVLEWIAISFSRGSSQPGIKLGSPALQAGALLSEPSGKPESEEAEIKLLTSVVSQRKQGNSEKHPLLPHWLG